jgi:hypothetical protein
VLKKRHIEALSTQGNGGKNIWKARIIALFDQIQMRFILYIAYCMPDDGGCGHLL